MIAVIFEVFPADNRKDDYLEAAARLKSELEGMEGFISVERFQSLKDPNKLLSLSFWRDEEAVAGWRSRDRHRARNRLDARVFSETIACELLLSFAAMICLSAASRHRPTVEQSMRGWGFDFDKAALRAELEAPMANYRGPVKQYQAAPPPELVFGEERDALDDEDEAAEDIQPGLR